MFFYRIVYKIKSKKVWLIEIFEPSTKDLTSTNYLYCEVYPVKMQKAAGKIVIKIKELSKLL